MPGRKKPVVDEDVSDVEEIDAGDAFEAEEGAQMDINEQLRRLMDPNWAEHFIATLDADVQSRVRALQGIQTDVNVLREKYKEEHKAIEKKYAALYDPIFAQRLDIISGKREPSAEEITKGQGEDFTEEADANKAASGAKGIPDFWLTAMNNHEEITDIIEERDEECLKSLTNITATDFEDPDEGFVLAFHFAENEFFTNSVLTKTYHLIDEDEVVLNKAEGCQIDWKPGKNLCVELKKKKQKAKGGKQTRTVTKEEPCDSFFNFFNPPQIPDGEEDDEDEEDEDEGLEEMVEIDYQIGSAIKESLIPKAVLWYTGEAVEHDDDDDDEDDFDDDDDDDDDDSEDEPPVKKGGKKGGKKAAGADGDAPPQPECKQQ